jgi:hypothetical protein
MHYAMKVYEGMDVYIHIFLTLALVGGEWSSSHPGSFATGERSSRYPLDKRLGGPQSRSGRCGEVKILDPTEAGNPTSQSSSP